MLIPAEKISTSSLADAPSEHLMLSVGYEPTLFWLVKADTGVRAIFLTGSHARHSFDAGKAENWSGVLVGPVRVLVDPSSAGSGEVETSWQLRGADGVLAVPVVVKPRGFNETAFLPILKISTTREQRVYFSRWSIGILDDENGWTELVAVCDGKLSGQLVPKEL